MWLALNEVQDDVLLIECDLIFDSEVLSLILNNEHKNIVLLDKLKKGMDGTVVTIKDNNKISWFIGKKSSEIKTERAKKTKWTKEIEKNLNNIFDNKVDIRAKKMVVEK